MYQDTAAGFETDTGFFRRPDIRRLSQFGMYRFRREGKMLQWHGPSVFTINSWDHSGTRLDSFANVNWRFMLSGSSNLGLYLNGGRERLRSMDYSTLALSHDYNHYQRGFSLTDSRFQPLVWSTEINYVQ